jgi:hypothetical protein
VSEDGNFTYLCHKVVHPFPSSLTALGSPRDGSYTIVGTRNIILELESDSTVTLNVVDVFSPTSYHIAYHLLQNLNLYCVWDSNNRTCHRCFTAQ